MHPVRHMRHLSLLAALLLALPSGAAEPAGGTDVARPKTTQELLDGSLPTDWRRPDPANTLYMELPAGRVVIELAPDFAPAHVDNIRTLARQGFWDGLSIYRSQDNFVVQFGDLTDEGGTPRSLGEAEAALPAEFARPSEGLAFHRLPDRDGWAPETGFASGFPAARDPATGQAWMAHCYGTVGAGRDAAPDSSTGAELYVVIGQAPRQLDRNITQVGRVLHGMELLSVVPRGSGPLGFHEDTALRVPIRALRLASDVPEAERTDLQVLRTDTPLLDAVVESRRNRRDGWYVQPAGHIDLCNITVPVRVAD